jgi:hypothetical protein
MATGAPCRAELSGSVLVSWGLGGVVFCYVLSLSSHHFISFLELSVGLTAMPEFTGSNYESNRNKECIHVCIGVFNRAP